MLTFSNQPVSRPEIARLSAPGVVVAYCRLPAWEAGSYLSRSARSSVGLSFTRQDCVVEVDGPAADREVAASSVVVTGAEPLSWLRVRQPSELIEISGDDQFRLDLADELSVGPAADLADWSCGSDPVTWAVAARLRALARGSAPADPLETESLARCFYGRVLVTRFGGRLRERGDGGLDARRLSRTTDYIDAHLGEPLSLRTLAEVAALSPFHFQRSFRRTTGCSPHQYVAMRRAAAARRMLAEGAPAERAAAVLGYNGSRRLRAALRS